MGISGFYFFTEKLLSSSSFCPRPPVLLCSMLLAMSAMYSEQMFRQNIPNKRKKFIIIANIKLNVLFDREAITSIRFSMTVITSY